MSTTELLDELLLQWETARGLGRSLSAGELCVDCPHLAAELARRIRAVESMEGILGIRESPLLEGTVLSDALPQPAHSTEMMPIVPGYRVVRVIGQGGMGVVYEAVQLDLGRTVAIKMISGPRLGPKIVARFRAEAEAAARIQHPNVLQIFEVGAVENRPFYSMEFAPGGTLADRLANRRSPLPPRTIAELVETLARAVHVAHGKGILHRDLKPANVLLDENGTPKIADFGLAKILDADSGHTQTGEVLGTPAYMAPEQAEGRRDIGPPTDVYALGAILYELLTGRPPFQGVSPLDSLRLVTTTEPVAPSKLSAGLPPDLEAVCLKCLEKEPARRYATARELADDLRCFLDGRPVVARRIGPLDRAWRWLRRHPRETTLVVIGCALLVAFPLLSLLGESWTRRHREQQAEDSRRLRAEQAAPLAYEILQRNCAECHEGAPRDGKPNFDALDLTHLLSSRRPLVVPGSADDSRLILRIADGSMPPEEEEQRLPRLTEAELTILRDWINGGAPAFPPPDAKPLPPVVPFSALAAEVHGIFRKHCYECHKFDVARGGVKILHHRLLVNLRKVVVPHRPDESELYKTLIATNDRRMPPEPDEPLPAREIALIRRWIAEGAPGFPRNE